MIVCADVEDGLRALPDGSAQCVVTSPPYWGLRVYDGVRPRRWPTGWEGCLGLDPAPELYVDHLVGIFREVRRVLHDTGVLWINLGDVYATAAGEGRIPGGGGQGARWVRDKMPEWQPNRRRLDGYKSGDLVGIPHMVSDALRADGWWLRDEVVWAKRNPIPESVSGWRWMRCRRKVQAQEGIQSGYGQRSGNRTHRENSGGVGNNPMHKTTWETCPGCERCESHDGLVLRRGSWRTTRSHEYIFLFAKSRRYFCDSEAVREPSLSGDHPRRVVEPYDRGGPFAPDSGLRRQASGRDNGRNPRSVWTLRPVRGYLGDHAATFPEELPERCITAGTPSAGVCSSCGYPWAPVVDPRRRGEVTGNRPTCDCGAPPRPAVVVDPFVGSGTTGAVARRLGRLFVGIDASLRYCGDAKRRVAESDVEALLSSRPRMAEVSGPLFDPGSEHAEREG